MKQKMTRFIANVSLPQKCDTKGNLAANWKKWIQIWKAYEIVTGLDKQPSTLRVATFITYIGPDALEIHTGLLFPSDDDRQNIDKVLELWQDYCIGKTNVIYERYRFNNHLQESGESIDAYATALHTLVETCEFGLLKEDLILNRLVCGTRDNSLRKKLLQEPKLTLDKCLDSCRAAEATKLQMQAMTRLQIASYQPFFKVFCYRNFRTTLFAYVCKIGVPLHPKETRYKCFKIHSAI